MVVDSARATRIFLIKTRKTEMGSQTTEAKLDPPIILCPQPCPQNCAHKEYEQCDMEHCAENANESVFLNTILQKREENFEDYGEGKDVDFSPGSPNHDKNSKVKCFSNLEYSFPSSGGHATRKMPQLYTSELLDINCSQCCKKVNLLNDLDARLRNIKASSPNRNISSTAFGHQLFQANHNVFDSSQESSTAGLFTESIDSCELNITEKVSYLEKKVTELENDSLMNADLKSKLKLENTQLVHRVHELEEQMKDIEARGDQNLEEESKRHCDVYSKMERDRNREIDFLCTRIQQLEDENGEMKTNVYRLKSQAEKLDQKNHKLRDQNDDLNAQILSLSLYEAKTLLSSHSKVQCLAAEIDNASRDELVDALKGQEENNLRLRKYMDKIILAILDHNPSILEIKC
ncbi:rab11 family-interacting protein 4A-like isoform X4 [Stigmatopora argus]